MVLRTAKQGRNEGNQFWGCSTFPKCRGTKPTERPSTGADPKTTPPAWAEEEPNIKSPVVFAAEPSESGYLVEAFESVALPAAAAASINREDVLDEVVQRFTGWRLESPLPTSSRPVDHDLTVVALAKDLLLRGNTPLAFAEIEAAISDRHKIDWAGLSATELTDLFRALTREPTAPHTPTVFDSQEEQALVEWILKETRSNGSGWSVQTQVHVSYLDPALPKSSRCDILLTHPDGDRIVVELDGRQHRDHVDADQARSEALTKAGYEVIRITTDEFRARSGDPWDQLGELLRRKRPDIPESSYANALQEYRLIHQIQVTTVRAIRSGHLALRGTWDIEISSPHELPDDLIKLALEQTGELLHRLSRLWDVEPIPRPKVCLKTAGKKQRKDQFCLEIINGNSRARFSISDVVLPRPPLHPPSWGTQPEASKNLERADGEWFLNWIYRKASFWEGQWECISRAIRGEDVLVLLPTGRGKSIAFQLAALLRPGPCFVVDPIISLMDDQIDNLRTVGITRSAGIQGRQSTAKQRSLLDTLVRGHYKFCFIAPERFQNSAFRDTLRGLTVNTPVSLIAVDEAHCVSEWGHDFRTAYLNLGRTTRTFCTQVGGSPPPVIALTGTASRVVLKDVQRALEIPGVDSIITPSSFDRPELTFGVVTCRSDEKKARLLGILDGIPQRFGLTPSSFFSRDLRTGGAGLVFCPHVNGKFGVVEIAASMSTSLNTEVEVYSGSMPRNWNGDWEQHKVHTQRDFKRNRTNVLACTSAFGMGIDKSNIRFTAHYGLPKTVESFYQEAGRAGRDQEPAYCDIILSVDDPERARHLLDPNTTIEEVGKVMKAVQWDDEDDVTRALWFHTNAFQGVEQDVKNVEAVYSKLTPIRPHWKKAFSWSSGGANMRAAYEKALHHLVILGVVKDYTVNFAQREFEAELGEAEADTLGSALGRYGRSYQARRGIRLENDFVEKVAGEKKDGPKQRVSLAAQSLLEFIYETIELARRRAMSEILQATSEAAKSRKSGELLKDRVLLYLTQTDWDVRLTEIADVERLEVDDVIAIAEDVVSRNHGDELRAASIRQLSSYPDQPAFLLLRAYAESCVSSPDWDRVAEDLRAGVQFGREKYGMSESILATLVLELTQLLDAREQDARRFVRSFLTGGLPSRIFARELCARLEPNLAVEIIPALTAGLAREAPAQTNPFEAIT